MITLKDIAKQVGVSEATVSLVMNGRPGLYRISDKTRDKVEKTAVQLGYCKNELARSVATGKSSIIGYIAHTVRSEYDAEMLSGAMKEASDNSLFVTLLNLAAEEDIEAVGKKCIEQRFRAVICRALNEESLAVLHKILSPHNIPIAIISSSFPHSWGVRIVSDDRDGMHQVIEHLHKLGHKNIAHATNALTRGFSYERRQGFIDAMISRGLHIKKDYLIETDKIPVFEVEIEKMLKQQDRPTAITCASDVIAMVALKIAHKMNLKIPEDISIVGFGNMHMSSLSFPLLTTVSQPSELMGRKTVEVLLKQIKPKERKLNNNQIEEKLPVKLVVRESTGTVKAN